MSGIVRVKKNREFFTASNQPFNDRRLSWEAKGMMGYLLSKPDHWTCRNADLVHQTEESEYSAGEYKVNRILGELKQYGYMRRFRERTDEGKFDWVTEIYESPAMNPTMQTDADDDDEAEDPIPQSLGYGEPTIPQSSMHGSLGYIVSTERVSTDINVNGLTEGTSDDVPAAHPKGAAPDGDVEQLQMDGMPIPPAQHPAVLEYRNYRAKDSGSPRYPRKGQMNAIIETIGTDDVALAKWKKVLDAWCLQGHNPTNVAGMLDWFTHGIPESARRHDAPLVKKGGKPSIQSIYEKNLANIREVFGEVV